MTSLDDIRRPIAEELVRYDKYLRDSFRSDDPFIDSILEHIISGTGKGIRPLLALLSGSMHHKGEGSLPKDSRLGAMVVEMVHNASLVHDDVVDDSYIRRGKASVNAVWHSHAAVLVGDYILSRCYLLGLNEQAYQILGDITRSMTLLCEGELIQSQQSETLAMTREIYYDIIYKKTATLIGASCAVGAISVGASRGDVDKMRSFGDMLGMAFQIKDDILDYCATDQTGKPTCGDLIERKINLPLLAVLEDSTEQESDRIKNLLRGVSSNPENVQLLYNIIVQGKGLEKAALAMNEYMDKALTILATYAPSTFRTSMEQLCTFVAEREK